MTPAELLVVDDNEMNLDVLARRLTKRGFVVTTAESGEEALAHIRSRTFDLVLLDLMMPGISGLEVLRRLRPTHPRNQLPVIITTAKAESEDVVEALTLGANDYVTKPIDFPVLVARIAAQLAQRAERVPVSAPPADEPVTLPGRASTPIESLGPGASIEGRYVLKSVLGKGGFAIVYLAQQVSTGQQVAIKVLRPEVLAKMPDPDREKARFKREMEVIGRLRHPHIVRLIDCGILSGNQLFTVIEYVQGSTLRALLKEHRLDPRTAKHVLMQVLDALSCAHAAGVVHHDLKPENIMVTMTGTRPNATVLDFGIASIMHGDPALGLPPDDPVARGIQGTPAYMAPEQLRGARVTAQSDIYAWGLVLLECLTDKPAVTGTSPASVIWAQVSGDPIIIPDSIVDPVLRRVLIRATAKTLHARYLTAQQAMNDLEDSMTSPSIPVVYASLPTLIGIPSIESTTELDLGEGELPADRDER